MSADATKTSPLRSSRRAHLIGIGGSGMSSLALLLAQQGKNVSGSDVSADAADRLTAHAIQVFVGHRPEHIQFPDMVIASAAIPPDNCELLEAQRRGIPVLTHAQALGELMKSSFGVAVAGTHGKTTTTAMLGHILTHSGLDPTVLVGAATLNLGSGARLGSGPHLVVEADEYDRRFLALHPRLAIITSLEADHLDYFRDLDEIVDVFRQFARQVSPDGVLVTNADDEIVASVGFTQRRVTYGTAQAAHWQLSDYRPRPGGGCSFHLSHGQERIPMSLALSGVHNASNATAAVAAAHQLGVGLPAAMEALTSFQGTERRFQTAGRFDGIWIVDDYAHHPTAVRATLAAAREVHQGRLWAVFQPHTTNRVAELLSEFATSFRSADLLSLLPIYRPPGRERGEREVTSAVLASAIEQPAVMLESSLETAEEALARDLRAGDLVVIMGAGDVTRLSRRLADRLASRARA